ncbi:hypothetical protein F2Q69_00031734 [Brassica cretica]|uniref:Uncharacterized protein n=1 Tax=Brassica cretica TaxID=69181 RepID=A0A8S9RS15_BRACR|nr:hypothetical protein F2Q69_00031734 [Brassica cretica]
MRLSFCFLILVSGQRSIEYCFIPLPLPLKLKTSDWLRVIIGVESCKAMLELI